MSHAWIMASVKAASYVLRVPAAYPPAMDENVETMVVVARVGFVSSFQILPVTKTGNVNAIPPVVTRNVETMAVEEAAEHVR